MDKGNIVCGPSAQRGGKKIDSWTVIFPHRDPQESYRNQCVVDIYMRRSSDSVYEFFLELSPEKGHPFKARLSAETPTELKNMLNAATEKDIEGTWKKQLMVKFDAFHNDHISSEDPGGHELSMEWRIVHGKKIGDQHVYVYDGELTARSWRDGWETMPWTQQREDVLRSLGAAIHDTQDRLTKLVADGKMAKALDMAGNGARLLGSDNAQIDRQEEAKC